jgi:phage tail sheath gpL-like
MSIINPIINTQILSANQESQNEEQKILFIGQKVAAGTAPAGVLVESIENDNSQYTLFGQNSILSNMVTAAKRINKISRIDAIPLDDDGAGVDATGTVVFGGAPTEAGTIQIVVGGSKKHTYTLAITSGASLTSIGNLLADAITADASVPVSAVNVTGTVTLTADNAGLEGNFISIRSIGSVAGLTVTITGMSGGATNPSLDNVLDVVENIRYQTIVFPSSYLINDTNDNILDFLENRWNPSGDRIFDGVGIMCVTDTFANLKAATYADNAKTICPISNIQVADSDFDGSALLELDYEIASQFAAIRALRLTTDANISDYVDATQGANDAFGGIHISTLPYHNTPFANLPLIDTKYQLTYLERQELKAVGWTILGNNISNTSIISDSAVTRYLKDAAGDDDLSFKYLNYVDQASVVREYFHNNLRRIFRQTRLTEGDLVDGYNMANAGIIKAELASLYTDLANLAIVISGETATKAFADSIVITIDEITGTVTIEMLDPVVSQLRQMNITMKLTFSVNS